ncbi:MAG TPA: ABC transporter permease subunit [Polyangia bacterium]|jgi:ABC-2 type transport system permease protein|nr:ABC transporter permease subunit [Polyangia bacterium]
MSPALVISRREIRTYFNSPVAYIVVTVFVGITGYLFFTQLFLEKQAELRQLFGFMPFLFMFMVPAITMRLLADEKSTGTLELLSTMPVRDWEVVLGKFLAALALLGTAVGLTLVFAISVRSLGPLDRGPAIGGYLGLVLMGGAFVAIGVMCSAFTRNSIVAFIASFGISFALYLFGKLTQFVPEALQPVISFLSIDGHFENIGRGVIDTRDVIYYLSIIGTCLLLATTSLESRRWR